MKKFLLLVTSFFMCSLLIAQSGPWAKYDAKMKGEALIREADGGYLKEVESIVEGGGDVNWQMELSGLTPLMAAVSGNHAEVVLFLLKHNADPQVKDKNGTTALARAKIYGYKDIIAILETKANNIINSNPGSTNPAVSEVTPELPPLTPVIIRAQNQVTAGGSAWPPFRNYTVGDSVRFFNGSWHTGSIIETGITTGLPGKNVSPTERKYLISRPGANNWNDWTDWGSVTGMQRENFWTDFFIGEWRLGETMSVNTKTEGAYQRDEYAFHSASEALSIKKDKTYRWKIISGKIITGKWKADADGAGIILLKGFQGLNWTLRNETNATEENIRNLQSARLTTAGKMSITAKRKRA